MVVINLWDEFFFFGGGGDVRAYSSLLAFGHVQC